MLLLNHLGFDLFDEWDHVHVHVELSVILLRSPYHCIQHQSGGGNDICWS
jgi:hypothetical protein